MTNKNKVNRATLKEALKEVTEKFSRFQTHETAIYLGISIIFGQVLDWMFPMYSLVFVIVGFLILLYWFAKYMSYVGTINVLLSSSSYLFQVDAQQMFGKKLLPMPGIGEYEMPIVSFKISKFHAILIFIGLTLLYIVNYVLISLL